MEYPNQAANLKTGDHAENVNEVTPPTVKLETTFEMESRNWPWENINNSTETLHMKSDEVAQSITETQIMIKSNSESTKLIEIESMEHIEISDSPRKM